MFANLIKHQVDVATLILRLGIAFVFVVHGYLKIEVGHGATSELVSGMSPSTMVAVGWAELLCGILVGLGLVTRVATLILAMIQLVAINMVSSKLIPQVVRSDQGNADYISIGSEFNVALIAMCLTVFLLGAGALSADHVIMTKWRTRRPAAAPAPATG